MKKLVGTTFEDVYTNSSKTMLILFLWVDVENHTVKLDEFNQIADDWQNADFGTIDLEFYTFDGTANEISVDGSTLRSLQQTSIFLLTAYPNRKPIVFSDPPTANSLATMLRKQTPFQPKSFRESQFEEGEIEL